MEAKIYGYTDPRTGEYKQATEANRAEVLDDMGFMLAWKFYWDGPLREDQRPMYDREMWIVSDRRDEWLAALSTDQRTMLVGSQPPEEVPALVDG